MIDRAIGIVGIALALLAGAIQYFFPHLPSWIGLLGYALGVLLVGLALGLLAAGGLVRKRPIKPSALLRLHIYGDHRTPDRIAIDNIFRWFFLQAAIDGLEPQGTKRLATIATLFVMFEDDVVIHTLAVRSPDMHLPVYEVKEFNQRYAIIVFSDNVPAGTLEVCVTS